MMGQPTEVGTAFAGRLAPTSVGRLPHPSTFTVHYVFSTHNRRPVFEVEEFRSFIERLLRRVALDKGLEVVALNVLAEHVHLLLRKDAQRPDAEVMKLLKGASARHFFLEYPEVKEGLSSQSLWAHRCYYSRVVPPANIAGVIRYIRAQKDSNGTDKRYVSGLPVETA